MTPLFDNFTARTGIGIKAGPDPCKLGLKGVARDEALRLPAARMGTGRLRGPGPSARCAGGPKKRAPGRVPDPMVHKGQARPAATITSDPIL